MTLLHPFEQQFQASWPADAWRDVGVLAAVSGGADSVALLRALHRLKSAGAGSLAVAHFDHGLRGAESAADARFVVELAASLNLVAHVGTANAGELLFGDGLEAAARQARYQFLQATAERIGARYLVAAHTADDQAETVLHRILRGTGIGGLAGMARARQLSPAVTLIRPLLDVRRGDVLGYLDALDQPFREDESNADRAFMRNRIRRELLPLLVRDYQPTAIESLLRLSALAADAQQVIDIEAQKLAVQSVRIQSPDCVLVDCRPLGAAARHLVREVLVGLWRTQAWPEQSMGFAEWDFLAQLASGGVDQTATLPGAIHAQKKGEQLTLTRLSGS